MAGQQNQQAQQASVSIGQQEQANQKAQQAAFMETMKSKMQGGQGTPLTSLFMKEGGGHGWRPSAEEIQMASEWFDTHLAHSNN